MEFLTKFSLRNSAAVIIITILITLGGVVAATSLKVESEPNVNFGVIVISTSYPNASPEDVLEDVTKPLERAIVNTAGLKTLESTSSDNHSTLVAWLSSGADADKVRDDMEKKINDVKLPEAATRPKIRTESTASQAMYYLAISNRERTRSDDAFNELVKDTLLEELESIDGVEKVETTGDYQQLVKIYPKVDALNTYGLSPAEIKQLIQANHVAAPVGSVTMDGEDQMVRVVGEFSNLEEIRRTKLFLPSSPGAGISYVELGEVADVQFYTDKNSISRLNTNPGIGLDIYKTDEANAVETGKRINEKLDEFRQKYPDLQVETVYDSSEEVKKSINGMLKEGILGAIMASVMILMFLRHIRSTLIVLVSIPLSILVSMIFMSWLGITLNMMSLFGMAIAVGRVVDDSIVVIENIFRHFQLTKERNNNLILYAAKEVSSAITSSTITTVAVFVPLVFVSGIVGAYFRPFALTVVCSLLASLLVAVTIVPLMARLMIMRTEIKGHGPGRLTEGYRRLLTWSLRHKFITSFLAFSLFIGSIGLSTVLNKSFLPDMDLKMIWVNMSLTKGTELEVTKQMVEKIEQIVMAEPQVEYILTSAGLGNEDNRQSHLSNMTIKLKPDADVDEALKKFRSESDPLMPIGGEISFIKPSGGGGNKYEVILNGTDLAKMKEASEMLKAKLKQHPMLINVKDNLSDTKDQVVIRVDRDQASEWGLSPAQIAGEVSNLLANIKVGKIKLDGKEFDMILGLEEEEANSVEKLQMLWIKNQRGQQVRLDQVASISIEGAPAQLMQKDEKQYIKVVADIISTDKGGVSAAASESLKGLKLPEGITYSTEGIQADINKSFQEMFYAIGAAVFMVYIVMVIAFGNATAPLSILLSLPLAAIGGLLGLFVTNTALDVTSLIGFLMLIGIVVTNAIVYVDRVQQQREKGYSTREALIEAGVTRLRPIIMTAVATIAALVPLALGLSEGTLMSKGLSIVVIGGLLTSTLLTLVVVPVGYEVLDKVRSRVFKKQSKPLEQRPVADV